MAMQTENTYWQRFWGKRVGRRRLLQGAALGSAGLAAAAVIGCEEEEGGSTSSPGASPSGGASDQPRSGGTITFVQTNSDSTPMDIHKISFNASHRPGVAYSKLMMHDLTKYPNELSFTGDLAESFEIPEPTTYVFHLNRGVKWQNIPPLSGRELKASDIVYSYERQRSEGVNGAIIGSINTIEATDDYTLRITLKKADADFLFSIADNRTQVIAPEAVEVNGNLDNGPIVGTGPWIFEERIPDQILKMRKNPDYFRPGIPYADRYESPVILDTNTAQAAFRTGQIHDVPTNGQITELLRSSVRDLEVLDQKLLIAGGGDRLWVSPLNGPTKDVRVRQALGKLFDRDAIIRDIYFGSGWKNSGIFTNLSDWLLPEAELNRHYGYNPTEAKQMLEAAGVDLANWKPQLDAGIASTQNSPTTEYYVAQLKSVGIDARIQVIDKVEITDRVFGRGETDFCICNNAPTRGTNPHLYTFFHTTGRGALLFKQLGDSQFDSLIDKQSTILNAEERKAAVQEVQRRNLELAIAIMVVNNNGETAISPKVGGFKNNPEEQLRFAYTWLRA